MSTRRRELLKSAIGIIAERGYGNLTMRALARECGMKLGALQYHFPTWEDLLTALAGYILNEYQESFREVLDFGEAPDIVAMVDVLMEDAAGEALQSDRLFPQLWAMARVEPVVGRLLDEIYSDYLEKLEAGLRHAGSDDPRAEAVQLMTLIEGSAFFMSEDRSWMPEATQAREDILKLVRQRYGLGEGQ